MPVADVHAVRGPTDVDRAVRAAEALADAQGFGTHGRARVGLATRELGTNLVRYAHAGSLVLSRPNGGVQIESHDVGPGIPNVPQALEDGYSTSGGLGSGLGAVRRLMDDFSITSTQQGTHIVAHAWLANDSR